MDCGDTVLKSKKIRVYPSADQRVLFRKWMGTARYVFNKTIEYLAEPGTKAAWKSIKGVILNNLPEWACDTPYQIKSVAVRDACKAVSNAKKKFRVTKKINKVHFKSRKNPLQTCYVPKTAVSQSGIYHTLVGRLKWAETLPEEWKDGRLSYNRGRWYVCLPFEEQRVSDNQGRVVSLDPGVRTFLTYYSEDSCGKLGKGDFGRVCRLAYYLDNLKSRMSKVKSKKRHSMKKAEYRLRWKIRELVDELHHKAARFLVDNFDIILFPTFETSNMVVCAKRKIRSKTVRSLLTWAHYRFKTFLKHKAFEAGKSVVDVNEAYTSKTVSWTGELVNVGSKSVIKSKSTGLEMCRDYNGARGIFIRALRDNSQLAGAS